MAKIAFTKLGLKVDKENEIINWNDQEIEIKQYLPVNEKLELISRIINNSISLLFIYFLLFIDNFPILYTISI